MGTRGKRRLATVLMVIGVATIVLGAAEHAWASASCDMVVYRTGTPGAWHYWIVKSCPNGQPCPPPDQGECHTVGIGDKFHCACNVSGGNVTDTCKNGTTGTPDRGGTPSAAGCVNLGCDDPCAEGWVPIGHDNVEKMNCWCPEPPR